MKVIYIAGAGRSGSTLLQQALGQIDNFVSVGELKPIWRRGLIDNQLCGCGKPFRSCQFWIDAFDQAFGGFDAINPAATAELQFQVDRTRYIPRMILARKNSQYRRRAMQFADTVLTLYQAIQAVTGCTYIIDSSKGISTALFLHQFCSLDLYVVHLIRDSRGVAYSWQRKKQRPEITNEVARMTTSSAWNSSLRWIGTNAVADLAISTNPTDRYMRLQYENFVRNPKGTLRELVQRFGGSGTGIDFVENSNLRLEKTTHTVAGNPNRFQRKSVNIRIDDEWKTKLSLCDKLIVSAISGPMLLRYGYSLSTGKPAKQKSS